MNVPTSSGINGASGSSGLEKFSHLVDKLHRSVALCEALKQEKDRLDAGLQQAQSELAAENEEKEKLKAQIEFLLKDRDAMKLRVEAMLDAIAMLELEADSAKK